MIILSLMRDPLLCPERSDKRHLLTETTDPALRRHLELSVMLRPPNAHTHQGPAIAERVQ